MIQISTVQLWVHDQDEALAFYTQKLGMEVRSDVTIPEYGDFRWLTVAPVGQEEVAVVLMAIPGPPVMDADTADQVRSLMAKGFAGTVFLTTDDCQASYEELKGRGVQFIDEPEERPYGIDSSFRDPSGNNIRLTQVKELATVCAPLATVRARYCARALTVASLRRAGLPFEDANYERRIGGRPSEQLVDPAGQVTRLENTIFHAQLPVLLDPLDRNASAVAGVERRHSCG